jgi:hypothetical protein
MKNKVENIIPEKIKKLLKDFNISETEVEKTLMSLKNKFPKDIYEKTINKCFDNLETQLFIKTLSEIKI